MENNKEKLKEKTIELVQQAIDEIGYPINVKKKYLNVVQDILNAPMGGTLSPGEIAEGLVKREYEEKVRLVQEEFHFIGYPMNVAVKYSDLIKGYFVKGKDISPEDFVEIILEKESKNK